MAVGGGIWFPSHRSDPLVETRDR